MDSNEKKKNILQLLNFLVIFGDNEEKQNSNFFLFEKLTKLKKKIFPPDWSLLFF